ncbi:MAG: DedA family protein [Thermus sp.]
MDAQKLVLLLSYPGLFLLVLAETGLLVGFALPGDSLLVTVGLLAAADRLTLPYALLALFFGSFLGHQMGYFWGRRLGPGLAQRVPKERLEKTQLFLFRRGQLAVVLAPLVPVVRTAMPFLLGALGFPYPRFVVLSLLGTLVWTQGVTLLGYALGHAVPGLERSILLVVAGVVLLSLLPGWVGLRRVKE